MKIVQDDKEITFKHDQETAYKVFQKCLEWYKKMDRWDGEIICQNDKCIIDAPDFMADLADNVFKFKVKYKD